jgi:GTP-binding protein YchF
MRVGIVGFAGSGKTTVFNALTRQSAETGFRGRERANLGVIKVPDRRVDYLADIYQPKKKTYAEISFVDMVGPEAASASGLDARLVGEMRSADALVHVVRAFANPALARAPDALRDLSDFESEMILTDLIQVEARREKLRKEGAKTRERQLIEAVHDHLEAGHPLRTAKLTEQELVALAGFAFLSLKPCLVLLSVPEERAAAEPPTELQAAAIAAGMRSLCMAGRAEADIAELDPAEQAEFLADLGLVGTSSERFIREVYAHLDLISFLTRNAQDCHAWAISRGTIALQAAGKVHSDIQRGFIRAEVIAFNDLERLGSEAACRDAGLLRVEGKQYEVQDGDVVQFRFNV